MNRLADETSPYLLQHADNPVDWYPWGEEALERARQMDRPILLSIGYAACHWCHVMERESFEDPETAALMNERFVSIKVDREERPDLDAIYMDAVQAMTGQGGWPLNVFTDPEGVPFYGGTYFPPEPRHGMPSFRQVLEGVAEAWRTRRDEIRTSAPRTVEGLSAAARVRPSDEDPSPAVIDEAERNLAAQFDPNFGGFGGAPKFPPASALEFLMGRMAEPAGDEAKAAQAGKIVTTTLEHMAQGGIYDQVGGGFARYSVDAHWLVPHFEKMLYDNALLARAYLHAWQLTGRDLFRRVCEETLDWALREMRGPEGGFYSALDADSEGEEGRFYVWTEAELREVLGDDAPPVLAHWGVDRGPNFEGRSILHVAGGEIEPQVLERARRALYEVRSRRVWPGLDDKRLVAWNALMIAVLADAGAVLGRADYLDEARDCARFVLEEMRDAGGRLLRTYKDGRAALNAYLEDHAFLVEALLGLYEGTFETRWFTEARALAETMIERFGSPEGGFFDTSTDHEALIVRPRSFEDHPIPSGNSSAAYGLERLTAFTGERSYEDRAAGVFRILQQAAARHPQAFGHLLQALRFHFGPRREVALVGDSLDELVAALRSRFRPTAVAAGMRPGDSETQEAVPLLRGREPVDGRPAAYVCQNFVCRLPVTEPAELERELAAGVT
ncbi:MAG: thioredoxin domain-containing protein [Solirubrobacterales bacterium]